MIKTLSALTYRVLAFIGGLVLATNITVASMFAVANITPTQVVAGITLTGTVAVVLVETGCSKSLLIASAEDVLTVVTDPNLIKALQVLSPGGVARLASLVPVAKDLIAAIKNGDTSNALALVNAIFPVIEEIAAIIVGVNPIATAILAVANIGLHFIINHVQAKVPTMARMSPAVRQALDYGAQAAWGCQYHAKDKRCTQ